MRTLSIRRKKSLVYFAEFRICDVRIDLRGEDTGVSEHLLDSAQIGTVLQERRGKGMPKRMR